MLAEGFIPVQKSPSEVADSPWTSVQTVQLLTRAGFLLKHFCRQCPAPQESLLQVEAVPVKTVVLSLWSKKV